MTDLRKLLQRGRAVDPSRFLHEVVDPILAQLTPGARRLLFYGFAVLMLWVALAPLGRSLLARDRMGVAWHAVLAAIILLAASYPARYLLAWQRYEIVTLTVTPAAAPLGGAVEASVTLTPQQDLELERLVVRLVGTESARLTEGSGKDRKTYTFSDPRVAAEQVIAEHQPLAAGAPAAYHTRLRVPPEAMHSFDLYSAAFEWRVEMEAKSPRFPNLRREAPLQVLPEIAADEQGRS